MTQCITKYIYHIRHSEKGKATRMGNRSMAAWGLGGGVFDSGCMKGFSVVIGVFLILIVMVVIGIYTCGKIPRTV